ncbi:MAG: protein-L-isoaspartate(D-aspartate) O-methyltransferase [Gemmatimonadetes bacterium]|uniref:Protein-L-isoaspartate O-methyltransferase n=1 Tax=Candidatus Kutchimonas denitrificans TaxID=3056748 RepID=A0AAE4Z8K1_9BACT|nr:protein-L-isoaspartate(D-aspartate) O-methyltransferase [Gemmatimonadota bacterium]NIR75259.1 protein-L-isoaspartate(D-aspartate) O-methyltransferase [Candidatus Kutchimonas denitrificans]NIS00197.1 protein-L-isoaspartate(D-aspartate) O-methyltransferase [Gemmatimonadota bacterium]NIT65789.1 protein-L-isoaspartate(D-aspartate) O-methyltransferase [Gemmatimonadota bacterium]NIU53067.1 protein-L-isoaspartate(D-aspartate) O-methyltransferase [Gemmatimonadota bacterium]
MGFDPRELTAYQESRRRLIERLRQGGITDLAVLQAFDQVPRHLFVPERFQARAYADEALPLGHGQTISRPTTHALYLQALRLQGGERALEVGTGSGFQTALLACLCAHVFSIELVPQLAAKARARIEALGLTHVAVRAGDGRYGWRRYSPYDAILVTARARDVPEPLVDQLAVGGRLLIPIGDGESQALHRIERTQDGSVRDEVIAQVRFVDFKQLGGSKESGEEVNPW